MQRQEIERVLPNRAIVSIGCVSSRDRDRGKIGKPWNRGPDTPPGPPKPLFWISWGPMGPQEGYRDTHIFLKSSPRFLKILDLPPIKPTFCYFWIFFAFLLLFAIKSIFMIFVGFRLYPNVSKRIQNIFRKTIKKLAVSKVRIRKVSKKSAIVSKRIQKVRIQTYPKSFRIQKVSKMPVSKRIQKDLQAPAHKHQA